MAKLQLESSERAALAVHLKDAQLVSALKKFFAVQEQYFTEQARSQLNTVPEGLDQKAKREWQAYHFAAIAKAYGQAWSELERVADSAAKTVEEQTQ